MKPYGGVEVYSTILLPLRLASGSVVFTHGTYWAVRWLYTDAVLDVTDKK
jgi:hypothetical protein